MHKFLYYSDAVTLCIVTVCTVWCKLLYSIISPTITLEHGGQ